MKWILMVAVLLLCGCSAPYLVRQVAGGVRVIASARPVSDALRDREHLSLTQRARLAEIRRALTFARRAGLDVGDSYDTFVDLEGRPLVYVLYASPRDRLEAKVWHFPIIGAFPYKGFFDVGAARRERDLLEAEGLETLVVPASAFSMLGWFPDPIFSTLLEGTAGDRCEVLFHELTHRTIFVGGFVAFNENLASFVGALLAEKFLAEEYGSASPELALYRDSVHDGALFLDLISDVKDELEDAYRAASKEARLDSRERIFAAAAARYRDIRFRTDKYRGLLSSRWSNPFILSNVIYHGRRELFAEALERCDGDLLRLFEVLRGMTSTGDPEASLEEWLADFPGS